MNPQKWRTLWHGLAVVTLVILLMFLVSSSAFKTGVDDAAAWTIQFAHSHPFQGAVIFVLFSALSAMLAFASSAVLVPPATAVWGGVGTFFLLWGGWTLGAAAAYGLGRMMTPLLIRVGYGNKLAKYQQFVSREMKFWAALFFCISVPSEIPGYLFGGAHFGFLKFIAAMAIAESLYAFGLVFIGEQLLAFKPSLGLITIVIVVAGISAFRTFKKRFKARGKLF